eukprot:GHVL01003368.1.p1 GENE.GHVL01003368.1~~GHVL01003368.1.p1  ORF type:complete len:142 (+),score=30.90 GHVL01003368.1:28-453(+)
MLKKTGILTISGIIGYFSAKYSKTVYDGGSRRILVLSSADCENKNETVKILNYLKKRQKILPPGCVSSRILSNEENSDETDKCRLLFLEKWTNFESFAEHQKLEPLEFFQRQQAYLIDSSQRSPLWSILTYMFFPSLSVGQ